MAEIVNLRLARKAKDRKIRAAEANANRARFGRSKSERATEDAEKARIAATLDGARRED